MVFSRNSVKALFWLLLISLFAYSLQNAELDRISKKSKDFTFSIESEEDWEKFVTEPGSKRKENVIILLTVGPDMRHQCPFCGQFRSMFGMLSVLFNKRHKEEAPYPIYFGVLEYKRNTANVVQNLGIKQVPSVLMFTPGSSKPYIPDLQKQNLHDAIAEHMDVTIDVTNVEEYAHLFEGEGGQARQGGASSSALQIVSGSSILILVLAVGSLIINFWNSKQHLLIVGSFFIYVLCAGGGIFNLLNGPPPFYMNPQTGSPVFFMPQMQSQFAFEGFIASTTMIVCSVCFIALTQFLPSVQDPVAKRMYGYAIMMVFSVSCLALVLFFLLKSPWYLNDSPLGPIMVLLRAVFIGG